MPLGEGREILLQPLVGGEMQDLVGLSPAAFLRTGMASISSDLQGSSRADFRPSKATLF